MNFEMFVLVIPALNQNFASVVQKSLPLEILNVAVKKYGTDARNHVLRFKIFDLDEGENKLYTKHDDLLFENLTI